MDASEPRAVIGGPERLARWLGVAQFCLLASWTVYAIYLPELLAGAGLGKSLAPWILLADQVVFAMFDVAAGFAADRAFRPYARIGPWVLGATGLSAGAFLLLPWVPSAGDAAWRGPVLVALALVWVAASAALRAPVFGLLARHAAKAETPALAGMALAGMAVAAALSPYLGSALKGVDPRLPFALSSAAIMLTAGGLVMAERRRGEAPAVAPESATPPGALAPPVFLGLVLVAALAFQVATNLNAAPRYLRDFAPVTLPWVLPVFWIGFSASVFSVGAFCRWFGTTAMFAAGCLAGAGGLLLAALPGGVAALAGHALAGLGWGAALASSFGLAADAGRPDRLGMMNGLLFATLAMASLARISVHLAGWTQRPELALWLVGLPIAGWGAAGVAALVLRRRSL